jgi:ammonium transporter, Amt family
MQRLRIRVARPVVRVLLGAWVAMTLLMVVANVRAYADSVQPDPGGSATGTAANAANAGALSAFSAEDLKALSDNKDKPATNADLLKAIDTIGQGHLAVNLMWTLLTGFLVMFMQAGFAMVETGFCRAKSAAHVIMTNFMIYPIGMLGFWIAGFAIMFGSLAASKIGGPASLGGLPVLNGGELKIAGFGIAGLKGFFLGPSVYDVGVYTMFLFQMVFMDTTATIPTGAMAERWRFSAFMVYGLFISIIGYPVYGHMVWGGGGLAMLGQMAHLGHGVVDFAGSSVVHAVGGFTALAGSLVLGPRIGKYTKDGKPIAIPGHHIPMAIAGTFILAFGWFGFNAGSTLAGTDFRIGIIATNTMLAGAAGAFTAMIYVWARMGKPDPSMMANGLLAGLVAITAPCAFVNSQVAVLIGGVAGVLVVASVFFVERTLKLDDPVGAISVHGVCGTFGVLSVGLFADGAYGDGLNGVSGGVRGLFYGDASQFAAQAIGALTCFVFVFVTFYVFFKLVDVTIGNRVSVEAELEGLDGPEMGAIGYPDFVLGPSMPAGGAAAMAVKASMSGHAVFHPLRGE